MQQTVRIIGGKYRGRKLRFPAVTGLRPTSDRIRETVFNWLMHDIRGACVLDAFAGSGALGFEAASRGAKKVVLVEKSKEAAKALQEQADLWKADNIIVICHDVLQYLQQTDETFDLVFLDPPFNSPWLQPTMDILLQRKLIANQGLVYVETNIHKSFDSSLLDLIKEKKAGQVQYRLLKRLESS